MVSFVKLDPMARAEVTESPDVRFVLTCDASSTGTSDDSHVIRVLEESKVLVDDAIYSTMKRCRVPEGAEGRDWRDATQCVPSPVRALAHQLYLLQLPLKLVSASLLYRLGAEAHMG